MEKFRYVKFDKRWFILTADYHVPFCLNDLYADEKSLLKFYCDKTGLSPYTQMFIVAPKGFVTDLASIPDSLQWAFKPDGLYAPAAAIHDLLYQRLPIGSYAETQTGKLNAIINKDFADRMFLHIMEKLGVSYVTRYAFYYAVKKFGDPSYDDDNRGCIYLSPSAYTFHMNSTYAFIRSDFTPAVPAGDMTMVGSGRQAHVKYLNIKRAFLSYPIPEEKLNVSSKPAAV